MKLLPDATVDVTRADGTVVHRCPPHRTWNCGDRRRRRGSSCEAVPVEITNLNQAPGYDSDRPVAQPLIEGSQSNVRIIRLSPGQTLPPHRHGASDLMLFAVEGAGTLETNDGTVEFGAGSLAFYPGDDELRISNLGQVGLTLLAFLAPPFPPRSAT
jgi:quercetin dioxygenase-like cupin family protein